ncbi:MAG TPA: hypothetical protein PLW72_00305 [Burkholderiaceae bacterium]|nr:hypothetical protein [Burkholderiaceae bacterium]
MTLKPTTAGPPTMHHDEHPREFPPVQTRDDGASRGSSALPLLLLGLLALMLLQTCLGR